MTKLDNINLIQSNFSVTLHDIVRNNYNIDLYEGEVLKIIKKSTLRHVVKPMETLADISKKYNVEIDTLINLNNLTSKRLFVGQILIIAN
ncbi:MAG: LysM peptidoglycan-binding domain-containing protein [Clostridia bacterium]|nr:LysM peptidoglycan-binding domain-containing protein [Clostridia bacterium]